VLLLSLWICGRRPADSTSRPPLAVHKSTG
jgi:hypothetical protein